MNDHKLSDAANIIEDYKKPNSLIDNGNLFYAATEYKKAYDQLQAELAEANEALIVFRDDYFTSVNERDQLAAQLKACEEIQKTLLRRIAFLEALTDTKED